MTEEEILRHIISCVIFKHNNDISPNITKDAREKENLLFKSAIAFLENIGKEENEQLKVQFDKLLDFVADRVEECDVCELTDTCINSEGVCPFAWSNRNIKDLIEKHITNK